MRRINRNKPSYSFVSKFKRPYKKSIDYIKKTFTSMYNIQEGSVRSAKTIDNIIAFAMNLEETTEPLHLAIGTSYTNARAVLFESEGMGLRHFPEWQQRTEIVNGVPVEFPQRIFETTYEDRYALVLKPIEGSGHPDKYIVPFGADNKSSHIGYRGWSIGMIIATEIDLFHENSIQEMQNRTIASRYRKYFLDFNPNNPRHAIYRKLEEWTKSLGGYNYLHKTLIDNPIMTPLMIEIVKSEYDPTSVDFKRYILGMRVVAEGLIYRLREYNILQNYNVDDYRSYVIVADPGVNHSATVFSLIAISRDNKHLDTLKEYYHKNAEESGLGIKHPDDYVKDYMQFIKECITLMGKPPQAVLTDTDPTFIREFNRQKYENKLGGITLNQGFKKDKIKDRIKTDINYFYKGRKRIYKECVYTKEAYETAMYDPKEDEKGNWVRLDDPKTGTMIDPIDTNEYAATYYRHELNKYRGD